MGIAVDGWDSGLFSKQNTWQLPCLFKGRTSPGLVSHDAPSWVESIAYRPSCQEGWFMYRHSFWEVSRFFHFLIICRVFYKTHWKTHLQIRVRLPLFRSWLEKEKEDFTINIMLDKNKGHGPNGQATCVWWPVHLCPFNVLFLGLLKDNVYHGKDPKSSRPES